MKVFKLIMNWRLIKQDISFAMNTYEEIKAIVNSKKNHPLEAKAEAYDVIVILMDAMFDAVREYLD